MKRLVFGVQYDGSCWHGWQTQPGGETVQDALEKALGLFAQCEIVTTCAGRTDAGVHAIEQVVHFDTVLDRSEHSWLNGVNAFLPSSIVVRWICEVAFFDPSSQDNFHARFSAHARTYHYLLYNNRIRSPMWSKRAGWVYRPLDVGQMLLGARHLVGEHDFTAFRAAACQAKSPIKQMYKIEIKRQGDLIVFSLRANAFLHHMVRNIMGALIAVGTGKKDPKWIEYLLQSRDRSLSAPTFMPDGLYLSRIEYDKKWQLPQNLCPNQPWFLSLFDDEQMVGL
ncbi:tRNA pseudouridine(38-40) synthase TruA [Undibacterium sp. Ren11W]|uniref:tRNA pseudouridine(38-40) synthase TruA n=1 Tax=Undibacterium sp. Ren11W TaxID=3413045 RepID=UPI003BF018AF